MSEDLKNGLLVAGVAVLAYLLYRETSKKGDVIVVKKEESPAEKAVLPVETVLIGGQINI